MRGARLTIGSISGALVSSLPGATRRWREMHGDISIKLELHDSDRLVHLVESGWFDLAVVRSMEQFPDVDVLMRRKLPYVAFARAGLTSLDAIDVVDLTTLQDPLIAPGAGFLAARCGDAGAGEAIIAKTRIDSYLSLPAIALAKQGLGVSIIEPVIAGHVAETDGDAAVIRPIRSAPIFDVSIIAPTGKRLSRAARSFAETVMAETDRLIRICGVCEARR